MPIQLEDDVSIPDLESRGYPRLALISIFTRLINSVRIFNVPILNFIIMGVLGTFLMKLTTKYTSLYMRSSLITIIVTNLVLYGISESLAQSILCFNKTRPLIAYDLSEPSHTGLGFNSNDIQPQHHGNTSVASYEYDSDDEGVERFLDYIQEEPDSMSDPGRYSYDSPFPATIPYVPLSYYNFHRLAGFMCWGLIMSFAQCWWYKFLLIYSKDPKFIEVLRKVLTDQLCFSPVSLFCFFTYGTMMLENGTWEDTKSKLSKIYFKTLLINYSVWVPIQFINFLFVPRSFQVPFSSSISVLWNCFLSMRNSQEN